MSFGLRNADFTARFQFNNIDGFQNEATPQQLLVKGVLRL